MSYNQKKFLDYDGLVHLLKKFDDYPTNDILGTVIDSIETAKADKVSSATSGNFAALDSTGNLTDSGHKHSDYLTQHQDISGKLDVSAIDDTAGAGDTDKVWSADKVAGSIPDISGKADKAEVLIKAPVFGNPKICVDTTTVSFSKDGDNDWYCSADNPVSFVYNDFNAKCVYKVEWDGVEYEVFFTDYHVVSASGSGDYSFNCIGNAELFGYAVSHPTDAPFAFTHNFRHDEAYVIFTSSTAASHTIKITKVPFTADIQPLRYYQTVSKYGAMPIYPGTGHDSIVIGGRAIDASGYGSISSGSATLASGTISHADGLATKASGNYSHSEGSGTTASGEASHAEGSKSVSSGSTAHAEGSQTTASGSISHAEGNKTTASGGASHAEGQYSTASGAMAHADGENTIANHRAQRSSGAFNVADPSQAAANQRGTYAEIIGNGTADNVRSNARTLDWDGNERLAGDVYVGCNPDSTGGSKLAKVSELPDVTGKADKVSSAVSGNFAGLDSNGNLTDSGHKHSDYLTQHQDISGLAPKANPVFTGSISMGRESNSSVGTSSMTVGIGATASGSYSFAQGSDVSATGRGSHAEGSKTSATGIASHAEGLGILANDGETLVPVLASGQASHAEGCSTTASAFAAHAEGDSSVASGESSHTEGRNTLASGYYSHAEGTNTTASGMQSHAEGLETTANHASQHVFGEYNVADPSTNAATLKGTYIEIIGNGTENANSNARALDWDGNEYLAGSVYVGCDGDSTNGTPLVSKMELDGAGITERTYTVMFGGQFSVTTEADSDFTYPRGRASVTGRLNNNYMYRVTFNGTEYILPARLVNRPSVYTEGQGYLFATCEYIGNAGLIQDDTSGIVDPIQNVPFAVTADLDNSVDGHIDLFTETTGTYTVKIERITNTQVRLPESLITGGGYPAIVRANNAGSAYDGFSIGGGNELKDKRATFAFGYGNIISQDFGETIGFANSLLVGGSMNVAIGLLNTISGSSNVVLGKGNEATGSNSIVAGRSLNSNSSSSTVLGSFNRPANKTFSDWANGTHYYRGDIVNASQLSKLMMCVTEHTSTSSGTIFDDASYWIFHQSDGDALLTLGNGQDDSKRSNALKIDWVGNARFNGDVFVNCGADSTGGTKLVSQTDYASSSAAGIVYSDVSEGVVVDETTHKLLLSTTTDSTFKQGTTSKRAVVVAKQHVATFYGLAKAAGVDEASSVLPLGTYTPAAKTAIQTMLGVDGSVSFVEEVSGTTPSITGEPNVRYMCGEVSSITITPPTKGAIDVVFESGTTAALLTVNTATGVTMKWPAWFDATALEANTTYEINIMDGKLGTVMAW